MAAIVFGTALLVGWLAQRMRAETGGTAEGGAAFVRFSVVVVLLLTPFLLPPSVARVICGLLA